MTDQNNGNGSSILELKLTDEIRDAQLITKALINASGKSAIFEFNHKYNKTIEVYPIEPNKWSDSINTSIETLKKEGIDEYDCIKVRRLLNLNSEGIVNHFAEQKLLRMKTGQRAKMERAEKLKNGPPEEVTISEALMMHEGNVRLPMGMISLGSDRIEMMITRMFFWCGECDTPNELKDYRDSRPMFAYEVPPFNLKEKKCMSCGGEFGHELDFDVINAYRTELQEPETLNNLDRLPIILFGDCTKNVRLGEQVIVTGSIHKIRIKNRLLTYLLVGLDPKSTLEYEHRKESEELTDADIKEFQELAKSTEKVIDVTTGKEVEVNAVLDKLVSKFAPTSVIGLEHVKRGYCFVQQTAVKTLTRENLGSMHYC